MELVIVKNVDCLTTLLSWTDSFGGQVLTFDLLIGNKLNSAADSVRAQQDISLASRAPSTCSGLHGVYCEPAYFSAYVSDFQEPLLHGRCDGILDLTT